MNNVKFNRLLVFERPLHLGDTTVYGVVYNRNERPKMSPMDLKSREAAYVMYIGALSHWINQGGKVEGTRVWTSSDGIRYSLEGDYLQNRYIFRSSHFTNYVTVDFDAVQEVSGEEVIEESLVISPRVIERFAPDFERCLKNDNFGAWLTYDISEM